MLSEESVDDRARLANSRVWIVDPLDGTREFGELGRTDWAVHVALWESGKLAAGAVAMPALGRVWGTGEHPPVRCFRSPAEHARIAISRTRPPAFVTDLATSLGAHVVAMGSAGAKAMAVVAGDVDGYVHAGGQYEWDSAAPVAVARTAGLHASRVDGSPLRYNQPRPWLPDLLICRADIATDVLAAIRRVTAGDM